MKYVEMDGFQGTFCKAWLGPFNHLPLSRKKMGGWAFMNMEFFLHPRVMTKYILITKINDFHLIDVITFSLYLTAARGDSKPAWLIYVLLHPIQLNRPCLSYIITFALMTLPRVCLYCYKFKKRPGTKNSPKA